MMGNYILLVTDDENDQDGTTHLYTVEANDEAEAINKAQSTAIGTTRPIINVYEVVFNTRPILFVSVELKGILL